jgi:NDP-4-keto-2,6-dideoxyhexose 3-C-methyltransferase
MTGCGIEKCRVCGNKELVPICDLGSMAFTGVFPEKADETVPEGPLELVKCHGDPGQVCGLVQLKHSFDPYVLFCGNYGYRSGLNGSMRLHLQGIASQVRDFLTLKEGDVAVDIGSNDGTLLGSFSSPGLSLIGIDPAAGKLRSCYPKEAEVIPDFFSKSRVEKALGTRKAKVVTAIAVFYDLENPGKFFDEIRDILHEDGIFVLEQSYLSLMLKNLSYDTICHEHVAYYGMKQIRWLADRAGLKIIHAEQNGANGGSFRVVLAKKNAAFSEAQESVREFLIQETGLSLDGLVPYENFRERILEHRRALTRTLADLRSGGLRIFGYGASTKGNVLMQFCGFTSKDIPYVADINEDKWGRFCPGTRIPIISEEEAMNKRLDVFLVLPWHFRDSFLAKEARVLKRGGRFLFPLPKIDLVGQK